MDPVKSLHDDVFSCFWEQHFSLAIVEIAGNSAFIAHTNYPFSLLVQMLLRSAMVSGLCTSR